MALTEAQLRIGGIYEHGIDLPNWRDYLAICKLSGQRGFLVIGEGDTGNIIIQSFGRLADSARFYNGHVHFEKGAVFWPCTEFRAWGTFNRQNGQLSFNFTFATPAREHVDDQGLATRAIANIGR